MVSGEGTNISANVPLEEISQPFKLINAVCLGRTHLKYMEVKACFGQDKMKQRDGRELNVQSEACLPPLLIML